MPINYTEKGIGLIDALRAAGYPRFGSIDRVFHADCDNPTDTSNDAAVQAIIDAYDPLPDQKADAVAAIKATALEKMQTLFSSLSDIDTVNLVAELWQSLVSQAKSPTTDWQTVINIYTAAKGGIQSVNAATDQAGIDSAVAGITWPI